jgi:quinol monooxygenase YgiN
MIKHIAMWKIAGEGVEKQQNIQTVRAALETCVGIVPGMLKYEVGLDVGVDHAPWDVVVYSEFTDRAALQAYQAHPTHQAIKPILGPLRQSRGAVDYEA